jgi:hypothetical protein
MMIVMELVVVKYLLNYIGGIGKCDDYEGKD